MPDAEKVAAVREALPAVAAGIYLDTPVAGPIPAEAAAAMAEIAEWELTTGRVGRDRVAAALGRIDEARAAVATILGLGLDEVVLVHGYEDAMRRVAGAATFGSAAARVVHATDAAAIDELPAALDRGSSLVVVDLVSPTSGALLPVSRATAAARAAGAWSLVDVGQAAGAIRLDPGALGADLIVARTDTWLLGPQGLAVIGGRREILAQVVPFDDAGWGADSGDAHGRVDFHLPSVVGLARSSGWLSMYVGLEWIETRGRALASAAMERLSAIPGVAVVTPDDALATIVVFRIAGWAAGDALEELGRRVFLLASSDPTLDAIRIGTAFFNTDEELDRVAEAVELLASHTPESLPRRAPLTILGQR